MEYAAYADFFGSACDRIVNFLHSHELQHLHPVAQVVKHSKTVLTWKRASRPSPITTPSSEPTSAKKSNDVVQMPNSSWRLPPSMVCLLSCSGKLLRDYRILIMIQDDIDMNQLCVEFFHRE